MKIKVILFDFDGTLVDSLPLIMECFRYTMNKMDLNFDEEEVKARVGLPLSEICAQFAGARDKELFDSYLKYQHQIHDEYLKEFGGTSDILEYLANCGYSIGVVTSKRKEMAKKGLQLTGIDRFIKVLIALEDVSKSKPDAEPLLKAIENIKTAPESCIYIGDSPYDIKCGKNAGVFTAGITWGVADQVSLEKDKPDIIIDNWQQLLDFLDKIPTNLEKFNR